MIANTIALIDRYKCIRSDLNTSKVWKKDCVRNNNSNLCTPDCDVLPLKKHYCNRYMKKNPVRLHPMGKMNF